ncbi:MAG: ATP-binding protein [Limnohabitans sp.]|nr:ATP-binding protein [Limnohabitans sp.]
MKKIYFITCLIISQICFGIKINNAKTDSIDYYLEKGNGLKAINFARSKSAAFLEKKDYKSFCDIMLKKAQIYYKFKDVENSLKTLYEARDVAEKNNLLYELSNIYKYIGAYNGSVFEFSKAQQYLKKSERIAKKINNNYLLCNVYQSFFKIHFDLKSDSTKYYLDQVDKYCRKSKDKKQIQSNLTNHFAYFTKIEDNILAKKYLDSSYALALQLKDTEFLSRTRNNLGVYYMTIEKNYDKSIEIYKQILETHSKSKSYQILYDAYLNISYAYEAKKDYKQALFYSNEFLEFNDEVFDGRLNQSINEIETKYKISKVEEQYKKEKKEIEERQARNQKILFLIAALIIFLVLVLYFYYQNLLLKQKNKIKDIDNELQYKIISATLDGQDQERNKISAILHDNVSATLSSIGLHLSALESSLTDEQKSDIKKTRMLLKTAHDSVRDLSHNLVSPVLVKFGLQYALNDLCERNSNSLLEFKFTSNMSISKRFEQNFETTIYNIISELSNNIIKHSKANLAEITINEFENNKLQITITDNGKGFNTSELHFGFGLTQIKARIKSMNGKLKIKSEENKGTKIIIELTNP